VFYYGADGVKQRERSWQDARNASQCELNVPDTMAIAIASASIEPRVSRGYSLQVGNTARSCGLERNGYQNASRGGKGVMAESRGERAGGDPASGASKRQMRVQYLALYQEIRTWCYE